MIRVKLDEIESLRLRQHNGTLQSLTRKVIVTGLKGYTSFLALGEAIVAVDESDPSIYVPRYGEHLVDNPSSQAYPLVVIDVDAEMVDKDIAHVTITYNTALDTDNVEDRFDDPFNGIMCGEVRCSIQQKQSNLDNDGNQVILSHQYPPNDKNFPNDYREQGGEFSYFAAQRTFSIHGIKATNTPWVIANGIVGRVNFLPWSGEAARTWMCVGCNWKLEGNRGGFGRYYMRFEFQFDADTFDPTIVYHDDVTGRPPANLVWGAGIKTIQKHRAVIFEHVLGTLIHGA